MSLTMTNGGEGARDQELQNEQTQSVEDSFEKARRMFFGTGKIRPKTSDSSNDLHDS